MQADWDYNFVGQTGISENIFRRGYFFYAPFAHLWYQFLIRFFTTHRGVFNFGDPSPLPLTWVYRALVYGASAYRASSFRALNYGTSSYKALVYDASAYDAPACGASVYGASDYGPSAYRYSMSDTENKQLECVVPCFPQNILYKINLLHQTRKN